MASFKENYGKLGSGQIHCAICILVLMIRCGRTPPEMNQNIIQTDFFRLPWIQPLSPESQE